MTPFKKLQNEAAKMETERLIKLLGYHSRRLGERAIEKFLRATDLKSWIAGYGYDGIHNGRSFTRVLARKLGLDDESFTRSLESTEREVDNYPDLPQPYIFVETAFKRNGRPLFLLALLEGERRIEVDKAFAVRNDLKVVLQKIAETVKNHYAQTGGRLQTWGEIRRYIYHHVDGKRYLFSIEGNLIKKE